LEGALNLKAFALIVGGFALIAYAIWSWIAWKAGKPPPFEIFRTVKVPRTDMNRISEAFGVFFEVLTGLVMIAFGLANL